MAVVRSLGWREFQDKVPLPWPGVAGLVRPEGAIVAPGMQLYYIVIRP